MTAEQHAAKLAEALREFVQPWNDGRSFTSMSADQCRDVQARANAALATWDRRNAPPPKQQALL